MICNLNFKEWNKLLVIQSDSKSRRFKSQLILLTLCWIIHLNINWSLRRLIVNQHGFIKIGAIKIIIQFDNVFFDKKLENGKHLFLIKETVFYVLKYYIIKDEKEDVLITVCETEKFGIVTVNKEFTEEHIVCVSSLLSVV